MEMDSVELNQNGDCIDDTSAENSPSPDSADVYGIFGDPELLPRVGNQYQVEIPAVITKSEYVLYKKNPLEVEFAPGFPSDFLTGLPIPVMWINKEVKHVKRKGLQSLNHSNGKTNKNGVLKSETNKEAPIFSPDQDSKHKVEPVDIALGNLGLDQEMDSKTRQKYKGEGCCLVPGSIGGSWSASEEASFLLGLYIFGKNLIQVKKFMESKMTGEIQSFYYGRFYRSDKYRRWSDCRKMRSRKCVYGQRIFTGLRQQELLSRLFLHVSEECKSTLLEVSKTFGEGKMLLEEYVSTLKALVGISSLVEAVGIGKGKRDLTGITMEPLKSNHGVSTRSEVPIGKACSSLTPTEIIKFLTGDFRLSKARSNDLFWEAVWPRLLARGWHSEQPKDYNYAAGYKHSLVFLMPGVKKFSRRRLVKGNHFFDSVTDVLSKVASDPGLLELETEADERNGKKEEDGWKMETKTDQRHCYLQPRTPNLITDVMKFTVVDTSMGDGKIFKMRELKTLPNEVLKTTISRSHSEESDDGGSEPEASSEDMEVVDTVLFDPEGFCGSNSANGTFSCEKKPEIGASNQGSKRLDSGAASIKSSKDHNNFCENKKPRKSKESSRGMKQDNVNYLSPVTKRRVNTVLLDQEDTIKFDSTKTLSSIGMFPYEKNLGIGDSKGGNKGLDPGTSSVKSPKDLNNFAENKKPRKSKHSSWGMKQDDLNYLAPVTEGSFGTMTFDQEDTNKSISAKILPDIRMFSFEKNLGTSNQGTHGLDFGAASVKISEDSNNFCKNKQPKKSENSRWGTKQDDLTYLAPVTKRRRRLSACSRAESSHQIPGFSVDPSLGQEKHICCSETTDSSENNLSGIFSAKKVASASSSKGSPIESSEGISCETRIFVAEGSCHTKPQPRPLIDLNLPQVSPDFETSEENETSRLEDSSAPNPPADVSSSEQQPNGNSRRQSTRNRPLTVKALEALANGFLTTPTRRKNKEAFSRENSMRSRLPRQDHSGVETTEDFGCGTAVASQEGEARNEESNGDVEILGEFQICQ
ncbi:uncharacterized protein LOC131322114 isoform X1 [Rhododendron vialii]|uniref:uncharacterized protein LOC131322114 isoform X1 n=2 Tax=Rhododendron vialii TaxID=182163 RepID=UPI00265DDC59|nr:uncharacterized protein LOC131322114 isoform X1 [Rhododendron vialii]